MNLIWNIGFFDVVHVRLHVPRLEHEIIRPGLGNNSVATADVDYMRVLRRDHQADEGQREDDEVAADQGGQLSDLPVSVQQQESHLQVDTYSDGEVDSDAAHDDRGDCRPARLTDAPADDARPEDKRRGRRRRQQARDEGSGARDYEASGVE